MVDYEDQAQKMRVAYLKDRRDRMQYPKRMRVPRKTRIKIAKLLAEGVTHAEIAKQVGLSLRTVDKIAAVPNKRFRQEVEKAISHGLELVRTKTHENVVAAASIVNAHLKAKEKEVTTDPEKALELSSSEAKDYAAIAEKEYNKLKSIDSGHTEGAGKRNSTTYNTLAILNEIKGSDIVSADDAIEVEPEQLGIVDELKPAS